MGNSEITMTVSCLSCPVPVEIKSGDLSANKKLSNTITHHHQTTTTNTEATQRNMVETAESQTTTTTTSTNQRMERTKIKRSVLLDKEYETMLLHQEREEFSKILNEQFSDVDPNTLGTLPEFRADPDLSLENDNSWQYWMSIMLQYQTSRSYSNYTSEEEQQQKQVEWQKEMRFQLMQQKRAIKREKRKNLKQQLKKEGKIAPTKRRRKTDKPKESEEGVEKKAKVPKVASDATEDEELVSLSTPPQVESRADEPVSCSAHNVMDLDFFDLNNILLPSPFPISDPILFAI